MRGELGDGDSRTTFGLKGMHQALKHERSMIKFR